MSENYNKIKLRVKTVEEAMQVLTHLALRADERMDRADGRMDGFEAALTNLTVKLEALADAQIRTEESLTRLEEAHTRLAQAQAHTDQRLDVLIDIVREDRKGREDPDGK